MKKLTSMVLALALCLGLGLAVPAFAAEYAPYTVKLWEGQAYYAADITFDRAWVEEKTLKGTAFLNPDTGSPCIIVHVAPDSNYTVSYNDSFPKPSFYVFEQQGDLLVMNENIFTITESPDKYTDKKATFPMDEVFHDIGEYVGIANPILLIAPDALTDKTTYILFVFDSATPTQPQQPTAPTQPTVGGFSDVKASDYFADPVVWAVNNKITAGTSDTTFSPEATCTQAQILTFLWRATGSPEPVGAIQPEGFTGTEYYYKAALWAAERGMITEGNFDPETLCTRAMAVTYMWNYAGGPASGTSSFTDVPAGASYAPAVAWAVNNGVTSGTGNNQFSPDLTCTRAQIVTFLYRAFAN